MTASSDGRAGSYALTTRDITVSVRPIYLDDQSTPAASHYVWAYQVNIANNGVQTVQLISRHWRITDAHGQITEVKGDGVVGEQPILNPGDSFEYTSGTPLNTPSGIMVGTYQMVSDEGEHFDIGIPAFSLDSPHDRKPLN